MSCCSGCHIRSDAPDPIGVRDPSRVAVASAVSDVLTVTVGDELAGVAVSLSGVHVGDGVDEERTMRLEARRRAIVNRHRILSRVLQCAPLVNCTQLRVMTSTPVMCR